MSRSKTVLLIIAAAPLLIYGGIKGYAYYTVQGQLDAMIRSLSPFAEIRYGGIETSFDGTVRVEEIRVLPHGATEVVRIDAAEIYTPGMLFLLSDADRHWRRGFPNRLGAAIQGLHLELNGPMMAALSSRNEASSHGTRSRGDGLACGWRTLFTPVGLRDLGYTRLTYDADLMMRVPGSPDELVLRLNVRTRNLQRLHLETRVAGMLDNLVGGATVGPRMRTLSVRYGLDSTYVRKAVDKCATESDLGVETLLERLAGQSDEEYMADIGFVPGRGIRGALVSFFRNPREIRVTAKPTWAVDWGTLNSYRPQDLPERLNLSVSLDKEEIADLSFTTVTLPGKRGRDSLSAAAAPAPSPTTSASSSAPSRKVRSNDRGGSDRILRKGISYRRVDKDQLAELVGRDIWVFTRKGLERQGRLEKVQDGMVWLTLRMRGGSMTTSVALAEAEQLGLRETRR